MALAADDSIPLEVSLGLVRTEPLTVSVKVTNNGASPLTVLTWSLPLDPLALQLGLLVFTPQGAAKPLEIPTIQVNRKVPPDPESLVTFDPGQSRSRELEVKDFVVPTAELFGSNGKATVRCRGRWAAVWPRRADELGEDDLVNPGAGGGVLAGPFQSRDMEIPSGSRVGE